MDAFFAAVKVVALICAIGLAIAAGYIGWLFWRQASTRYPDDEVGE